MSRQFYRMQAWWAQLSGRERSLLALMLLSSVVILFIFGIWQPMRGELQRAQQQVNRQSELLEWVKSRANQIESLRQSGGVAATTHQPLNQAVATSSKEFAVSLIRIQPRGEELQVWVDALPFNRLLDWINYLSRQQGVQVTALDIERTEQSGMVEVRRLQFR